MKLNHLLRRRVWREARFSRFARSERPIDRNTIILRTSSLKRLTNLYLKLTAACQTKANSMNNTGMIGSTSTMGSNGAYASGNFASNRVIINF